MLRLTEMFVEQANLPMSSSVWLHVSGVSLSTDMQTYQPPVHSYDYRTKHLQSPVPPPTPPLGSPSSVVPCSITVIDGPYSNASNYNNNKQIQNLDSADASKKFFIDRHIKKAKSLPGLIKGTALSRHTPLQSSTFTSPSLVHPPTNTTQNDQLPMVTVDHDDESLLNPSMETRRPRVYFADFNKIQFIDDNSDLSQQHPSLNQHPQHRRRRRRRLTKKTSNTNGNNQTSPSIQQTQILHNSSYPLFRQPANELSIKKQQLFISPRVQTSRITHLPDILNQSLPIDPSSNENSNKKYRLQREKPVNRLSKLTAEMPNAFLLDDSSEDIYEHRNPTSPASDVQTQIHELDLGESNNSLLAHNSPSISQTSINRTRPSLRTISLRQQFITPMKLKSTGGSSTTNTNQYSQQQLNNSLLNTRRSSSLKHSILRGHDDSDDQHSNNGSVLATEAARLITNTKSVKQLKRSDVIHFNSKNPFAAYTINDPGRSHVHESTAKRFQNLLTIVRPPYASGNGTPSSILSPVLSDSTLQANNQQPVKENLRPKRSTSARDTFGYHSTSNTIIV